MGKIIRKLKEIRAFGAEAARQALERPLYSAGMYAFSGGVSVAGLRNHKARLMADGHKRIWKTLEAKLEKDAKYVWIHAASLGEFEQARPVIERIKERRPDLKVLLTFFSPSGYEVRKDYPLADIVCYLPFDTPANARRFVEMVRPECAVFVKYEIWRNFLEALDRQSVPTYLISAVFRPDQAFFRKSGSWYRAWLRWFRHIFVQNEESRRLLAGVGIDNVTVCGDTRFDRVSDIKAQRKEIPEIARFAEGGAMTLMVGSSWPADEDVYTDWVNAHRNVRVIIAPHEFDAHRLELLRRRFKNGAVLLSELSDPSAVSESSDNSDSPSHSSLLTPHFPQVLIIDCFGLLSSAYAYADAAYVGGAFGAGLHNINEAAVYGIPVVFGPKYDKFVEAKELTTLGGAISIDGKEAFEIVADRLLYNIGDREQRGRWAAEYISEKIGASDRIFAAVFG